EKALQALEEKLLDEEEAVKAELRLKAEAEAPLPASVGAGKARRKLTPDEEQAIRTFREFARDRNPVVRAVAVEDLGAIDSAVIVDQILDASNDVDPRVVEAAGVALARMKSQESLAAMADALAAGNAKARLAVLKGFALGKQKCPAAVPRMIAQLKGDDDTRRAAIEALAGQNDPAAADPLTQALSDSGAAIRVIAASTLGELRAAKAVPALASCLKASDWSLKKAAAEALGKIRTRECIEPLLERFESEEGLMLEVLHKSLVAVTGQDFTFKPERWRAWWEKFGDGFAIPSEKEIAEARARAEKALEGYAKPDKRKYHKIETLSRKLVFVLDISSSMADKIPVPAGIPEERVNAEFPSRVRMDIAKNEMIELLKTLDGNVYFNIITFAGRVQPWEDTLVSGTQRNAAIKFVAKLEPVPQPTRRSSGNEQKTNTYGALLAAFGLQEAAIPNWQARTQVDTIFLVTDGLPT
ncbi:MAG: HEAT repeat domain-containing protein, partial [Myxococcota bacterium]